MIVHDDEVEAIPENDWVVHNRSTQKWTRRELAGRVMWGLVYPVFRFSPRPIWGWRRWLLRLFGAKVAADANIFPTVQITIPWNLTLGRQCAVGDRVVLYALGPIVIGERATVSQGAHLCAGTHDLSTPDRPLVKSSISIGNDVWIAADAFVGPDVKVGHRSIVGARSVVMKDVDSDCLVAGNPARKIKEI